MSVRFDKRLLLPCLALSGAGEERCAQDPLLLLDQVGGPGAGRRHRQPPAAPDRALERLAHRAALPRAAVSHRPGRLPLESDDQSRWASRSTGLLCTSGSSLCLTNSCSGAAAAPPPPRKTGGRAVFQPQVWPHTRDATKQLEKFAHWGALQSDASYTSLAICRHPVPFHPHSRHSGGSFSCFVATLGHWCLAWSCVFPSSASNVQFHICEKECFLVSICPRRRDSSKANCESVGVKMGVRMVDGVTSSPVHPWPGAGCSLSWWVEPLAPAGGHLGCLLWKHFPQAWAQAAGRWGLFSASHVAWGPLDSVFPLQGQIHSP